MSKKILIVGGGVCGLTSAYKLQAAGFEVQVLDVRDYSGGRTQTVDSNGCKVDQGASLLVSSYVEALQLARELGLGEKLESVPGTSSTYIDGKFHRMNLDDSLLKSFFGMSYLSMKSKLSMARMLPALLKYRSKMNFYDLSVAADSDVETAEEFCSRLVPREVYTKLINPLMRGMYIANGDAVSVTQMLWILSNFSGVSVYGFSEGMQSLANALAERVPVRYGVKVKRVEKVGEGARVIADVAGETVELDADLCLITTDGKDLQELYGHELTGAQNHFLEQLTYAPIKMVTFMTSRRPDQEAVLSMPTEEDDPDLALIVMDHLYGPSRAPAGTGMISFLAMYDQQKKWLDDPEHKDLLAFGEARLRKYYPEVVDSVTAVDTRAWQRASTVGIPNHYRCLKQFVDDIDRDGPVQYTGDYMVASSVGVAVSTGNRLAERVIARWGQP